MNRPSLPRITQAFFGVIFLVLLYQAIRIPKIPEVEPREDKTIVDCTGAPIFVPYAFEWTIAEPHACKPQCTDGKQRYIVYNSGLATQCEAPPGCNDIGEDTGVTCKIPAGVTAPTPNPSPEFK